MVEMLSEELLAIGLNLNASKTKFFTTVHLESSLYLDLSSGLVEVMFGDNFHKYLGRHIPGNLKQRGSAELHHRIAATWTKFHKHRHALVNKHVSIKSRLRLFQSVVTPTLLYGL